MNSERETILSEANQAFERFLSGHVVANEAYIFEVVFWPLAENPLVAATAYFQPSFDYYRAAYTRQRGEPNWQFQLTLLQNGQKQMREVIGHWLKCPLGTEAKTELRFETVDFIVSSIKQLGKNNTIWKFDVYSPAREFLRPFYECAWDDFIIQTEDGFLFLHLGVSD